MDADEHFHFQRALLRAKLIRDDNLLAIIAGHDLDPVLMTVQGRTYRACIAGVQGEGSTFERAVADALSKILMPEIQS